MKSAFQMVCFGEDMWTTFESETTTYPNSKTTGLILRHISQISSVNQTQQPTQTHLAMHLQARTAAPKRITPTDLQTLLRDAQCRTFPAAPLASVGSPRIFRTTCSVSI
ncbi:hypothetical protein HPB48_003139 [Haemaphysalis longicornis]|uniref:Uncharacterized protein n=1 Tax=Haemaphysalis longicornis TaxID=44386 RepID=A0A9J6GRP1_HAELO|nr:hypothetical protein HPB48_003139 [Haemaphysalis longicornis]